jgi:glucose/arabinose dehydrogenase
VAYESLHYKFFTTKWVLPFIQDTGVSGPFEVVGQDLFLFVSRCGLLSYVARRGEKIVLIAQERLPFAAEIYCDGGAKKDLSGVKDLLITSGPVPTAGDRSLYLSYESQPTPGCIVLKVVRFDVGLGRRIAVRTKHDLFQSRCAPEPITHTQAGGAFAETASHIYFSVGDFGHGRSRPSNSNLTSIFRMPKSSDRPEPEQFAIGMRNSEGLAFAPASNGEPALFATEMGPKGGDEINVVSKGDDFGFSDKSYGLDYEHDTSTDYVGPWDDHSIGKEPEYVFIPAVAPTDIAYYDGAMFKNWHRSLLMTTLHAQTLYRIRLRGTRIVYAEPIAALGERMRFIRPAPDGSFYLKADPDRLIRVHRDPNAKAQPIEVAQLVAAKGCFGCHSPQGAGSAPSLRGMQATAIYHALNNFAAGTKFSPLMNPIAGTLSYLERKAIAEYLAALP